MSQDDKAVKANQDAATGNEVQNKDQKASADQGTGTIDYKAELEAEKAKRIKAEEDRDNYRKGLLKAKGKLDDTNDDDSTKEDDTAKVVADLVGKELEKFRIDQSKSSFETALSALSTDPAEKDLIQYIYENSIVKTGTTPEAIKEDLENAKLIANKKAILKQASELSLATGAKQSASNTGQGTNSARDKDVKTDDYWSPEQLEYFKKRGIDPNKVKEVRGKQLEKGYKLQ